MKSTTSASFSGSLKSKGRRAKLAEKFHYGKNLAQSAALISAYVAHASLGKLAIRSPNKRLWFFTKNIGRYTSRVLRGFHFDVEVFGFDEQLMKEKNFLFVCNHISYLDIILLSSITPAVFVTSVDLGETAFLGTMAELGGSIFVERRHRSQVGKDLGVMAETLKAGHNVIIFPEGTSTDGAKIYPFKKSLLMSAVEAGVDLMPVVIKYTHLDGKPITAENRDTVAWHGDMTFLPHFLNLMSTKSLRAEIHFLKPIPVSEKTTRQELAERAHAEMSAVYLS